MGPRPALGDVDCQSRRGIKQRYARFPTVDWTVGEALVVAQKLTVLLYFNSSDFVSCHEVLRERSSFLRLNLNLACYVNIFFSSFFVIIFHVMSSPLDSWPVWRLGRWRSETSYNSLSTILCMFSGKNKVHACKPDMTDDEIIYLLSQRKELYGSHCYSSCQ